VVRIDSPAVNKISIIIVAKFGSLIVGAIAMNPANQKTEIINITVSMVRKIPMKSSCCLWQVG